MADDRSAGLDDNPQWTAGNARPPDDASEQLRAGRAILGLRQRELADLLGALVATLRNREQRRTQPDDAARTLIRLLVAYPQELRAMLQRDAA